MFDKFHLVFCILYYCFSPSLYLLKTSSINLYTMFILKYFTLLKCKNTIDLAANFQDFDYLGKVNIMTGTFSKSFGCVGGGTTLAKMLSGDT